MSLFRKIFAVLPQTPTPIMEFEIAVLRAFQPYQEYFPGESYRMVIEYGLESGEIVQKGDSLRAVPKTLPTLVPPRPVVQMPEPSKLNKTANIWRSIEEAPQDGTHILLDYDAANFPPVVGFWGNYHPNSLGKSCWRCSRTRDKLPTPERWAKLP